MCQLKNNHWYAAFRAWRRCARVLRGSSVARARAVQNWSAATRFWELHCPLRLFRRWRDCAPTNLARAISNWMRVSTTKHFHGWHQAIVSARARMAQAISHHVVKCNAGVMAAWRAYTVVNKHLRKLEGVANKHADTRLTRSCLVGWRIYVEHNARMQGIARRHVTASYQIKVCCSCWDFP